MIVNPAMQTHEVKTQYDMGSGFGIKRFFYLRSIIFVQYIIVNMNAMLRKQIKNEINQIRICVELAQHK